jgi:hypothetical protein
MTLAEQLFKGTSVEQEIEMQLDEFAVPFDHIGWDDYDQSIEIYGVENDYRLSPEVFEFLKTCGFVVAYVNHKDGWETHYDLRWGHEPSRVNYGRGPRKKNG